MPGSQLSKAERVIALAGNLFPAALYSRSRSALVGLDFLAIVCRSTGTDDGIALDVDGCCCSSAMLLLLVDKETVEGGCAGDCDISGYFLAALCVEGCISIAGFFGAGAGSASSQWRRFVPFVCRSSSHTGQVRRNGSFESRSL